MEPGDVTRAIIGKIVVVKETRFHKRQGIIMDTESDLGPEDRPIAVFFDTEVPGYLFTATMFEAEKWKGVPTPENYRDCPRIMCFGPGDLEFVEEFSYETVATRLYGNNMWHHLSWSKWPLVSETHECWIKDCQSGKLASIKTFVNYWGTVMVLYTCAECNGRYHGICTESVELKDPLPGAPATEKQLAP